MSININATDGGQFANADHSALVLAGETTARRLREWILECLRGWKEGPFAGSLDSGEFELRGKT